MDNLINKMFLKKTEKGNKKKIENTIFLIVILIITIILMNKILKTYTNEEINQENNNSTYSKEFANLNNNEEGSDDEEEKIAEILKTIKGVGNVKVYVSYSESSSMVPLYDETMTTSNTEEDDSEGGKRNITETETNKEVVFSEESGEKTPITEKTTEPIIKGAIITAEGASNASVKTNIVTAIEAVTGLSAEKIQVFEMDN